jgi:hypothetical protein
MVEMMWKHQEKLSQNPLWDNFLIFQPQIATSSLNGFPIYNPLIPIFPCQGKCFNVKGKMSEIELYNF